MSSKIKIPNEVDLALFLIIVSIIIYCFLEVSIRWGITTLVVGTGIFLVWIHSRTKLFG